MDDQDDYISFYTKFRQAICDKLRKKGDRINYFEEQLLLEDEILTPTFEDIIVLWCLEKISPQLPKEVTNMLEFWYFVLGSKNIYLNNFEGW